MTARDHDEVVRHSFERQVPLFSGPDSPCARRTSSSLSWIEPLTGDMIVLDVACGAAHASEPVAPHVRQVIGVDLTPPLLHVGARRLQDNGISNVVLQEANAQALPFVDESFDVVFCRSSLHHFDDPHQAVSEMIRVCRIGGRVVLVDLVAPRAAVRDLYDHVHRLIDPSHVRAFLEAELADLLPGGCDALAYAETSTIRLPVDIAFSDQSERAEVVELLRAEVDGSGEPTGFDPEAEDDTFVVAFTSCVVHTERR